MNMTTDEIVETLKTHYSRDIRKQLIKSMLEVEKSEADLSLEKSYKMINQIFSYVLQESGWKMGENSDEWNDMPLKVMEESFPKLNSTKWYKEQIIQTQKSINVVGEK